MELHFQRQHNHLSPIQSTKFKQRTKPADNASATVRGGGGGNKFLGVRQRPSGRWVAEIKNTTQKIRMWLGTFDTAEAAARAYDEAACLLRGANTRTNFTTRRLPAAAYDSPLASRIQKLLHRRNLSGHQNASFLPPSAADLFAVSPTTSTESGGASKQCSPASEHDEEVYRPDFSIDFELGSSAHDPSLWEFDDMFGGIELCKTVGFPELSGGAGVAAVEVEELERLKVERQISASLYAMNGVHEYLEAVQDLSLSPAVAAAAAIDPVWDLPPLYHFYSSF